MRCEQSKLTTVKALQSIGYDTIASGDSHNDIGMILASKAGFLFKSTDAIKAEYPQLPAYETYDELMDAIKEVLQNKMRMNELQPGQCAYIQAVEGEGALRHHLLDMGLTPGTEITLQRLLRWEIRSRLKFVATN